MPLRGEGDRYWQTPAGTIIVREGGEGLPWLVTWLPDDEDDPAHPGVTLSSTVGEVPEGPSVHEVANWAFQQPWANRGASPPEAAKTLDVPSDEWADVQKQAFEHQLVVGFTREPDGGFSWGVSTKDGELLQHGVAPTWDDARLAMIENLHPPSGEK